MAVDLKDFRLGITESIDDALEAESRAFGKDKAAIAREVLAAWAARKDHEFRIRTSIAIAKGTAPAWAGVSTEEAGASRSGVHGKRR